MVSPTALDSEPFYCWHREASRVTRLARRLFIMSPCRPIFRAEQILSAEHPVFFMIAGGDVPAEIIEAIHARPGYALVLIEGDL